ncbi:hypothetical protein SDC03_00210 [Legionella pneumophila serogroup 1]
MAKYKKKLNAEKLNKFLSDYFDGIEHIDAAFYLKYPYLDLIIEVPITEKRYKCINKAKKILQNVLFITQAMNLLLGNYEEYLITIKKVLNPWHEPNGNIDLFKNLVARKLSNLLSSTYAYTEHTRKLYHQVKSSPSFDTFKDQHINNNSILEEVRNYSQHTGLPIHQIKFDQNGLEIFVDLVRLKDAKDRNRSLIERCAERVINVTNIMPGYINNLWLLHVEIIECLNKLLLSSDKIIIDAINEIKIISKNSKLDCAILVENKLKIIEQFISLDSKRLFDLYTRENHAIYSRTFN